MDNVCLFRPSAGKKRVLWEITRACNLACRHCYVRKEGGIGLPFSEITAIADRLPDLGIDDVILSGGEPLLRGDILEIVSYLHGRGLGVDLCTNGTLVDRDRAKQLARYLSEISVSLDGCDAESYARLRGDAAAFDRTRRAIAYLGEAGCEVHVITVVTNCNWDRLPDIVRLAQELGAESITLLGLLNQDGALALSPNQHAAVRENAHALRARHQGQFRINTKRIFDAPPFQECRAGIDVFGIDASGQLLPCILFRDLGLWETARPPLYTLSPDRLLNVRRQIEECAAQTCDFCPTCRKGCLGSHWVRDNEIGCDTSCVFKHAAPDR